MKLLGNWSYPTNIRFGAGRISEIVNACKASGISNPLLVTDRVLADLPITAQILDLLESGGKGACVRSIWAHNGHLASFDGPT